MKWEYKKYCDFNLKNKELCGLEEMARWRFDRVEYE